MKPHIYSLSKFLAHAGVCSRRNATLLIESEAVMVNGTVITEPGHKITSDDVVTVHGKKVTLQKHVYILLNKPAGCVTTTSDPEDRKTVMDVVGDVGTRMYPVGRLDYNTTGLLLLTNDGALAQKLSHPKYEIQKEYKVVLSKDVSKNDIEKIKKGVILEDGPVEIDSIEYIVSMEKRGVRIVIHSGKTRVIRRLFERLGYFVKRLDRSRYAGISKRGLKVANWRYLTDKEVEKLVK